ncbi:MAG TPA: energy transducer TonB [Candidatus Elarobacter sp.]|jgi:hypothetical protein|nr:energy transducer TonB [Candidatus Elarobacter sp.]
MSIANVVRLSLALSVALSAPVPARAQDLPGPDLGGHWRCTGSGIPATERSFFSIGPWVDRTKREIFSSADTTTKEGLPATSFERIAESLDGTVRVQALEGNGTLSAPTASAWRFTGRSFDDAAPFTLMYAMEGGTLHRLATRGTATVDDERCTREPETPIAPNCAQRNVPATTLHAVEPEYPAEAIAKRARGMVTVRLVLDDRSRVLWADIDKSADPTLNDASVIAARDSTFRTAIVNCRPVAAVYFFGVEWDWR